MAGRVLAAFVHVVDEHDQSVVLVPGTQVPAWAASQITNPKAYVRKESAPVEAPVRVAEPVAPAPPVAPVTEPTTTPETETPPASDGKAVESGKPYGERSFPELQVALKSRGLSAQGNTKTLIARLEADDRDKAAEGTEG